MEFNSQEFKKDIITHRCIDNNMSMDEAAKLIGISKSTLSRLEMKNLPDIETFSKVCTWLGTEPNKYFDFTKPHLQGIQKSISRFKVKFNT